MSDIKWQDPPASKSGPGSSKWADICAALRQRPGEWALVREGVKTRTPAVQLPKGLLGGPENTAGLFEATARQCEEGGYNIWARYVGEAAS